MKITEQQVKDCYENKELLKELFPDVFKTDLEVGKWYIGMNEFGESWLFNFNGDYDIREYPKGYGFNSIKSWKDGIDNSWGDVNLREATREEVEKALIAEAEKRGFKEGVKVKGEHFPEGIVMSKLRHCGWDFWFDANILWYGTKSNGSEIIFQNGKWAEIIQETEIELTLDQIAEKFGVDKVKIKKD